MSDRHASKGQSEGPINQHKALAEGQKVTGMKKGGAVEMKTMKKMAKGGCMKKGGMAKKK